jgi:hypothetical protein
MDFAANSSVNTVAGLSLQRSLKALAADERAGKDDNARFRSFVVVGLNQKKLIRWLGEVPCCFSDLFFFFFCFFDAGCGAFGDYRKIL